jgi:hypothetical protein
MRKRCIYSFIFIIIISLIKINAQDKTLIFQNDSIAIYDTHVSLNSKENISPVIYKNGLIYASANSNGFYKLYYSDLKNKPQKIKIKSAYHAGLAAIYNSEIYLTKSSKLIKGDSVINLALFKGTLENLKVSKLKPLAICKPGYTYTSPTISSDGNTMVVVTNERGVFHLLELKRNEKNEWERSDVVFISQTGFKIINPTFFDENTIYFSSNISEGIIESVEYGIANGQTVINNIRYKNEDFNLYKIVKIDGTWSSPIKLKVLNSDFDDLSVVFKTEKTGYLNTFRYDDTDNIYYFELKQ